MQGHEQPALGHGAASGFRLGHRRWLDGLRGVAVLLVLAFHLRLLPGGFLGVDLFFVLSGFLITTLLAEEWERSGTLRLTSFYLRRAWRILPALAVLLLVCLFCEPWLPSLEQSESLREVTVAASFLTNWPYLHQAYMPRLGHTWSLALEMQFYLLWPLLLAAMLRLRLSRRCILLVLIAAILACAGHRLLLHSSHRPHGLERAAHTFRLYAGLDTRADALLAGCVVGLLAVWGWLPRWPRSLTRLLSLAAFALLATLAATRNPEWRQYYRGLFTVVAVIVAFLVAQALSERSWLAALLEVAPLPAVGRISYSLYLCHIPVIYWLRPAGLGWDHPRDTALVALTSFAVALLAYWCVERPCLRLKGRLPLLTQQGVPEMLVPHRSAP
jgi:peptidoglycan/LPS O-acetylase OafA/YrhL